LKIQSSVPVETAPPGTLVQVAIVYRDNQVSIYRDGNLLSQYPIQARRVFGPESMVLLGKRHLRAWVRPEDPAHFAGEIEDARIYDCALRPDQLQELEPNAPSTPAPWAWWTFDAPGGADRTGRFPVVQFARGATIRRGRLFLDGKDGNMLCTTRIDTAVDPPRDVLGQVFVNGRKVAPDDPDAAKEWG
jgi:hypothetical protein